MRRPITVIDPFLLPSVVADEWQTTTTCNRTLLSWQELRSFLTDSKGQLNACFVLLNRQRLNFTIAPLCVSLKAGKIQPWQHSTPASASNAIQTFWLSLNRPPLKSTVRYASLCNFGLELLVASRLVVPRLNSLFVIVSLVKNARTSTQGVALETFGTTLQGSQTVCHGSLVAFAQKSN